MAVHKLRTQISTLLQEKTVEGRWSAIILVKSIVEAGGWETLQKSGPWVRSMLTILGKRDPPSTKKLCLITLARIFMLTRNFPTLTREITTPSLPPFISACLSLISSQLSATPSTHLSISSTILRCFSQLLPRHPTVFRSFSSQIRGALTKILDSTALKGGFPVGCFSTVDLARLLFVQLHRVAPKGTTAEEWEKNFESMLESIHLVADQIFRCVLEDWKPMIARKASISGAQLEDIVQLDFYDPLGLPGWKGIHNGVERLTSLLEVLKQFFSTPNATEVTLKLGATVDLLTRLFSVTVPSRHAKGWETRFRVNDAIERDERNAMWAALPNIHKSALELLTLILDRCGEAVFSVAHFSFEQIIWIFEIEYEYDCIRTSVYTSLARLLQLVGQSLNKSAIDSLSLCIRRCCDDLLERSVDTEASHETSENMYGNYAKSSNSNADTFLDTSLSHTALTSIDTTLYQSAYFLLPCFFKHLPVTLLSRQIRSRIDQAAVLSRHKAAMVASVLNPCPTSQGSATSSVLPLLARLYPNDSEVEAILHPRMPVLGSAHISTRETSERNYEEDEELPDVDSGEKSETSIDDTLTIDHLGGNFTQDSRTVFQKVARTHFSKSPPAQKRTASPNATDAYSWKRSRTEFSSVPEDVNPQIDTSFEQTREMITSEIISAGPEQDAPKPETVNVRERPLFETSTQLTEGTTAEEDDDDDFGALVLGPDSEEEVSEGQ